MESGQQKELEAASGPMMLKSTSAPYVDVVAEVDTTGLAERLTAKHAEPLMLIEVSDLDHPLGDNLCAGSG
jgi:hypothetical protein